MPSRHCQAGRQSNFLHLPPKLLNMLDQMHALHQQALHCHQASAELSSKTYGSGNRYYHFVSLPETDIEIAKPFLSNKSETKKCINLTKAKPELQQLHGVLELFSHYFLAQISASKIQVKLSCE